MRLAQTLIITMRHFGLLSSVCWASTVLAAFDYNRAGGVLKAPTGESFKSVAGTFTIPALAGDSRLSIWVGIGDSTAQTYVLGGGILYNKTLSTWAAFYPSAATDITSEVPVKSGDNIRVTVDIEAGAGGSITIQNKSQNTTSTKTIQAPAKANPSALTALTADWWVQAYQVTPGELVKTPSYGTVSFADCSAITKDGAQVPIAGAWPYEIQGTRWGIPPLADIKLLMLCSGQVYSKTNITNGGISVTGSDRPLLLNKRLGKMGL